MSLFGARFVWFGNSFHSMGADAQKDFSRYIAAWLWDTAKSEKDWDYNILTDVYFWIRPLSYSDAVPPSPFNVWNRILYSYLTYLGRQCSCSCYMVPFVIACHHISATQFFTRTSHQFVRETRKYYIPVNSIVL